MGGGGGEEYEWVNEAMKDYSIVAELLIRLKHSDDDDDLSAASPTTKISTPLIEWGVRLPRSRQILQRSFTKKQGESLTRASPTTPLSWSGGGGGGGTSLSGSGGDGGGYNVTVCEDSSKTVVKGVSAATSGGRSKGNGTNELTTNRRSRKKKTFAELKESENSFLSEKIRLKRELATLKVTLEQEKAKNTRLKRMKLESQFQTSKHTTLANVSKERLNNQFNRNETAQTPSSLPIVGTLGYTDGPTTRPLVCLPTLPTCPQTQDSIFELPDLNVSIEEDSGTEILYGMS